MTFKKAEMAKTLKNGLSMIETNPLNHDWLDFAILSGLTLHQFQKKLLLSNVQTLTLNEDCTKLLCPSWKNLNFNGKILLNSLSKLV